MKVFKLIPVLLAFAGAAHAQEVPPPPVEKVPSFAEEAKAPAPDYRNPASWFALPDAPGYMGATPANAEKGPARKPAAVFYIHPTTFTSRNSWNERLPDPVVDDWTERSVVNRQGGAFNGCCDVYAPRYRQASLRAGGFFATDGGKAYELAYSDVARAFDRFIELIGDKPFIVTGHSQGALMTKWLLQRKIDGSPLQKRLVAGYVIGISLTYGDFGATYKSLKPCEQPSQTGCVLSWNTFAAGSNTSKPTSASAASNPPGAKVLCSNPLALGGALKTATAGALPAGNVMDVPALIPGAVKGACNADGMVMVDVSPELKVSPLPGGSYHYEDVSLFYAEVRADAIRRATAFRK